MQPHTLLPPAKKFGLRSPVGRLCRHGSRLAWWAVITGIPMIRRRGWAMRRLRRANGSVTRDLSFPSWLGGRSVKTFRSAIVLKRPQQELWKSMRDHLVEVAEHIADIESICQLERTIDADGKICIVNEWTVQRAL